MVTIKGSTVFRTLHEVSEGEDQTILHRKLATEFTRKLSKSQGYLGMASKQPDPTRNEVE